MSSAPVLDRAFLEDFEDQLRALGAPIVDAWANGRTDEEIDTLLAPLGIDLPEEARIWWRWHDGTVPATPMVHRAVGSRIVLSLRESADGYRDERGLLREMFGLEGLLRPVGEQPLIYFGCSGPRDGPVPIYVQNDIEDPVIKLPSIRALVTAWLELIDVGAWRLGDDGQWVLDHDRLPPGGLELGVF